MKKETLKDKEVYNIERYKKGDIISPKYIYVDDFKQFIKDILEEIEMLDMEFDIATEVKDKKGNRDPLSDVLVEMLNISWDYIKPKIVKIIKQNAGFEDLE